MSSHKIYIGVPTDGKSPKEYAAHLSRQVSAVFRMAFENSTARFTQDQLHAMIALNRFNDELVRIAFPPRRRQ